MATTHARNNRKISSVQLGCAFPMQCRRAYRATPVALSTTGLSNSVLVSAWSTPPSTFSPAFHFARKAIAERAAKRRSRALFQSTRMISIVLHRHGNHCSYDIDMDGLSPLHHCFRAIQVLAASSRLNQPLGPRRLAGHMAALPVQSESQILAPTAATIALVGPANG
eukprot:COSAG02_NODE_5220_length_4528_cov_2.195981_2_plen_167_part_00